MSSVQPSTPSERPSDSVASDQQSAGSQEGLRSSLKPQDTTHTDGRPFPFYNPVNPGEKPDWGTVLKKERTFTVSFGSSSTFVTFMERLGTKCGEANIPEDVHRVCAFTALRIERAWVGECALTEEDMHLLRKGELKLWHVFWLLNRLVDVKTLPRVVNESHQEALSFLPKEKWPDMNGDTEGILKDLVQMLAESEHIEPISKLWEAHFRKENRFFSRTVRMAKTFHQKSIDNEPKPGTEASTEFTVSDDQVSTGPDPTRDRRLRSTRLPTSPLRRAVGGVLQVKPTRLNRFLSGPEEPSSLRLMKWETDPFFHSMDGRGGFPFSSTSRLE
jgi:hypothetical protein